MNQAFLYILMGALWSSCNSKGASLPLKGKPDNYVVILDVSDRLIHSNQTDIDTCVIRACFEKFEASVQRQLTVKSKDKFCVRVIQQQGSLLSINDFENRLSLDLSSFSAAEKRKKLVAFKDQLGTTLKQLYQQAYRGNQTSAYFGVDIWQYFNEQVNTDIDAAYNNKITILTDGYFDFEDPTRGLSKANQSTVSKHLLHRMNGTNWRELAEKNNTGIIPVKLKGDARFLIMGIQPKTNDPLETEKLAYLWEKWIRQSGATVMTTPIANASSGKMTSLIKKTL